MNELIELRESTIGGIHVQSVNARDLYLFLGPSRDFSHWIKDRIEAYSFSRGIDFEVFVNSGENPQGGRPATEYALTLDMAKELAMVERNAKGKEARQYFIECERKLRASAPESPFQIPKTLPEALRLAADLSEKVQSQAAEIAVNQPKALFFDRFVNSEGLYGYRNAGRVLDCRPNLFVRWLRQKYLHYEGSALVPYAQYHRMGLFDVTNEMGSDGKSHPRGWVTPKGVEYFSTRIPEDIKIKIQATKPAALKTDQAGMRE